MGSISLTLYITNVFPNLITIINTINKKRNKTQYFVLNKFHYSYRTANSKLEYSFGFSNVVNSVELEGNFNFNHSAMLLLGSMING